VPSAFISNTDLTITCTSGAIVLDGSGSSGTGLTYTWTTDGFINGPTDGPTANAEQPGTYQLLVTSSGCKDSTSVEVLQDDAIPTADAGPDKIITCTETSFTIGGASTPGLTYAWTTAGGNITGAIDAMTTTADKPGAYTITVRDEMTGCESNDQMTITIDTAVAAINLVAGDTIDCGTTTSTATATLNEPLSDYTTDWTTVDGLIVNENGANVEVSQGGTYTFVITNNRNGCVTSDDVEIAESDEIIDAVNVLQKNITCFGDDDGALTIESVEGGGPTYTYTWSVGASGTALTLLSPGTYSLTVTDQNGCSFESEHTITEPEKVTIDIGPNLTVQAQDSVRIDLLTNVPQGAIGTIDWGGYDGIFCPGCPSFQFIATSSATISATISDTAGCTAYDSLRLTVIVPRIIFIPNIFSPNGDGINDNFTISGRFNLTDINFLRIYDRWGNQLFEATGLTPGEQSEGWDGNFNEDPMQPGVYVFVAELQYEDGYAETISGNITLVR
jgi:gliding motility-associated-like protein